MGRAAGQQVFIGYRAGMQASTTRLALAIEEHL
jgi:hypothetical protein